MVAGFYVTITGLPSWFYTDRFFVDLVDGWTVAHLIDDIKSGIDDAGSYELHKDATALTTTDLLSDALEADDTLAWVEV